MPLKTNVGVSRKVADNNYGSRGASVNLEVELDSALIQEPERFQDRIRQVFRLAQQAIDDELSRQQGSGSSSQASNGAAQAQHIGNGHATNGNATNGRNGGPAIASEKQLTYAQQLAKQVQDLGVRRLEDLSQRMYSKPLVGLTTMDASGLIDTLKALKEGRMDLETVLNGAA